MISNQSRLLWSRIFISRGSRTKTLLLLQIIFIILLFTACQGAGGELDEARTQVAAQVVLTQTAQASAELTVQPSPPDQEKSKGNFPTPLPITPDPAGGKPPTQISHGGIFVEFQWSDDLVLPDHYQLLSYRTNWQSWENVVPSPWRAQSQGTAAYQLTITVTDSETVQTCLYGEKTLTFIRESVRAELLELPGGVQIASQEFTTAGPSSCPENPKLGASPIKKDFTSWAVPSRDAFELWFDQATAPFRSELSSAPVNPSEMQGWTGAPVGVIAIDNADQAAILGYWRASSSRITDLAVSPTGLVLAAGKIDGSVEIWDLVNGWLLESLTLHQEEITAIAFSPEGDELTAVDDDGRLIIWETKGFSVKETIETDIQSTLWLSYTPDHNHLLILSKRDGLYQMDLKLGIWELLAGELQGFAPTTAALTPDGRQVVIGYSMGRIQFYDLSTEALSDPIKLQDTPVDQVLFPALPDRLITWLSPDTLHLWDTETGSGIWQLDAGGPFVISPDDQLIACSFLDPEERGITFLDLRSGETAAYLPYDDTLDQMDFSPDGRILAVGGSDGLIMLVGIPE